MKETSRAPPLSLFPWRLEHLWWPSFVFLVVLAVIVMAIVVPFSVVLMTQSISK
jgi:hypothetical protein